ncbi:MFS general substrate transporter [Thozetella sp. PMI_491]|nr:MFS general substrate transporter [Thozetella sp. PMI_491]
MAHSAPEIGPRSNVETNRAHVPVYSRFKTSQKRSITAFLAFCGLLATISTTCILSAIPELTTTFDTTASIISISNAVYLALMGISSCIWGPSSDVFGRRKIYLCTTFLFFVSSIGTAFSPSLLAFFIFRGLTAAQGTAFLILASSCISDIYHPTERATSLGWFLTGSMSGPAFGPVLGGIIVTYQSWRVIFYLQAALAGVAFLAAYFVLPETIHSIKAIELKGQGKIRAAAVLWKWLNPMGVLKLYGHKNFLLVTLASSALVWNMYSLLTPVRLILNPRLNLKTPLQSGLLYLSPGAGYVIGTTIGGRWADYTVRVWMRKRGYRLPEDRLRSCLPFLGILLPGSILMYGWMVDRSLGGIPVPVICMFVQGVAQLASFPSLNTYILDILQHRSGEASASHYMMRYCLAGISTAICLPMLDLFGVGWTSTLSAGILIVCAGLVYLTIMLGEKWRDSRSAQDA